MGSATRALGLHCNLSRHPGAPRVPSVSPTTPASPTSLNVQGSAPSQLNGTVVQQYLIYSYANGVQQSPNGTNSSGTHVVVTGLTTGATGRNRPAIVPSSFRSLRMR